MNLKGPSRVSLAVSTPAAPHLAPLPLLLWPAAPPLPLTWLPSRCFRDLLHPCCPSPGSPPRCFRGLLPPLPLTWLPSPLLPWPAAPPLPLTWLPSRCFRGLLHPHCPSPGSPPAAPVTCCPRCPSPGSPPTAPVTCCPLLPPLAPFPLLPWPVAPLLPPLALLCCSRVSGPGQDSARLYPPSGAFSDSVVPHAFLFSEIWCFSVILKINNRTLRKDKPRSLSALPQHPAGHSAEGWSPPPTPALSWYQQDPPLVLAPGPLMFTSQSVELSFPSLTHL
ncbi:hypothetical protein P7K49_024756 [Saguinus oedipus]|uniref:Uncharacterized protein n=1 Tax=Saguinus oedipus TaxID=9490 RepID=A0ABQ9UQF0_SAGOE|nr:hypothetical protein P7K49_024756 [Saguinus oedipus]